MNREEVLTSRKFWRRQWTRYRKPGIHRVFASYISQNSKLLTSIFELNGTALHIDRDLLGRGFLITDQIAREMENSTFPEIWNVEINLASYFYANVLAKNPLVVVETGIVNGFSQEFL